MSSAQLMPLLRTSLQEISPVFWSFDDRYIFSVFSQPGPAQGNLYHEEAAVTRETKPAANI
jgi:hypothetical protein